MCYYNKIPMTSYLWGKCLFFSHNFWGCSTGSDIAICLVSDNDAGTYVREINCDSMGYFDFSIISKLGFTVPSAL